MVILVRYSEITLYSTIGYIFYMDSGDFVAVFKIMDFKA